MKLIACAGSSSKSSINKKLVTYVSTLFSGMETEVLDINDFEAPIYSADKECEIGIPEIIKSFAQKISDADLVLLSLAEHNGSYSAAFKNLYDWVSRIPDRKVFDGTPLFLMATSPGEMGGSGVLEAAERRFPKDGAKLMATFSLPMFYELFSSGVGIIDIEKAAELADRVHELQTELNK
jgi:NAD(P)H-dependent FMN reductase